MPVISSVAATNDGCSYNINADTIAGEISASLQAEKLILLTDTPGILRERGDSSTLIKQLRLSEARQLIKEGVVKGGYNEEGRLLNHEWDWEIISLQHTEVSAPAPTSVATAPTPVNANNNTPNPIASTTPVSSTMSKDMVISRTAMLKSMIENHSKPVNTWDREDMGHATVIVAELVKIIYDEWK